MAEVADLGVGELAGVDGDVVQFTVEKIAQGPGFTLGGRGFGGTEEPRRRAARQAARMVV